MPDTYRTRFELTLCHNKRFLTYIDLMERVNHDILQWARQSAGLSLDEAVQKLAIKDTRKQTAIEALTAYESGEKNPSRSLLVKMSGKYRRPLLTFYLNKIPATGDRGEDFRTLPQEYDAGENATLDALLRDIKVRQNLVKAALIDEDEAQPLSFIGSCSLSQTTLLTYELLLLKRSRET